MMTRKSSRLPSLSPRPSRSQHGLPTGDLRSARYKKVGDDEEDKGDNLPLLPDMGDDEDGHPMPYYETPEVALPPLNNAPWLAEVRKKNAEYLKVLLSSKKLQGHVINDLLNDFIQEELTGIASLSISQGQYQEEKDLLAVEILEEDLLGPGIHEETYLVVWSLLFDMARDLDPDDYLELKEKEDKLPIDEKAKQALMAHVLEGDKWADDLSEEKILSNINWEILIYHYYANLHHSALAHNVAMHMLQEQLAVQAAGEVLITEGLLEVLEREIIENDAQEKTERPPRWAK